VSRRSFGDGYSNDFAAIIADFEKLERLPGQIFGMRILKPAIKTIF
jgi:hypothetical protein